jgi:asparagine synthase (glutamine-hydrolysing)
MCGIILTNFQSLTGKSFNEALKLMNHRGPDYQSSIEINGLRMGHNRLSIIDLDSRSNQPFSIDKLHIIYNGELYNFQELKKRFKLNVTTTSDTEVVLLMYKKFGPKCLEYFNGMFAFAIYDENTNDIFVARDRLGIKPLYYNIKGKNFLFSSEIAPMLEISPEKFDDFGIRQYRKLRMTVKNYTVYNNIKFFPAGHYWFNGTIHKYWDFHIDDKKPPSDEELEELIKSAVIARKVSDVPLGSYLSGGLDSTILSYILKPSHTWTVGFADNNEFFWGNLANKSLGSIHNQTIVNSDEFIETARWMIKKRKEPLSVPNEILIYLMTLEVKKNNTVVLSGEGADELFFGYHRIFNWANGSKNLALDEFDEKYCYGTNQDHEVIDFALEGIEGKTVLDKIAYFFQIDHLHGLLRRLDNATMLCGVEARVPFVDHRLVERLAGCPFDWKMGKSFKEPLKRIYNNTIPKEIIDREKIGFAVDLGAMFNEVNQTPMDSWLEFNLDELIRVSKKSF